MAAYSIRKQFSNDLFDYTIEVYFQLHSFSEYIRLTEDIVENEIKLKLLRHSVFLKEESEEMIELYYDNDDHKIRINLQRLYYNSLFISLYSFLERKLYQLCKIVEDNHCIKTKDLSGEGIFKYYKYLKKVAGLNLDKLNTEWNQITKFNKLRNLLVHHPVLEFENSKENQSKIDDLKSITGLEFTVKEDVIEFSITDKRLLSNFQKIISIFLDYIYYEKKKK